MSVTALTLFKFNRTADKLWAFGQMQFSRKALSALPHLQFYKMFGTGTREGFHPYPNWGVYALLITGPSRDWAQEQSRRSSVFQRYRDHADEALTLYLDPISCRGSWSSQKPFEPDDTVAQPTGPIAFLTRATVKLQHIPAFWRTVPAIAGSIARHPDLLLQVGMGEIPWKHQVTFTVWPSLKSMHAFAYNHSEHARGVQQVRAGNWFAEELFARFSVIGHHGTWQGRDPIPMLSAATPRGDFDQTRAARTRQEPAHV